MLDEQLSQYRKKLEKAISKVLTDSPEIRTAIQEIRNQGYETFLIVEATIGFNRNDSPGCPSSEKASVLELTGRDEEFLKSLKISPE